jgi:hypothetical protein
MGESVGIGESSPEVINSGIEPVFHPHEAIAVD